jgi:acetolactate synthase-1/2/3 large subunit
MNPGTTELHLVAALDRVPGIRPVPCLFEGVATGAADGYGRMAERPASTLLHTGPGLANGLANLHNARKAGTPIVNLVGDHAIQHRRHDAPLSSDVAGFAMPASGWVQVAADARSLAENGASALAAALEPPGRVATLIVPADCAWGEADGPAPTAGAAVRGAPAREAVDAATAALRSGEPTVLLMTGAALRARGLDLAARIAAATGARTMCNTFNARWQRGAGRAPIEPLPYFVEDAIEALAGTRHLVLVGASAPVGFFAYPGRPSELAPPDCAVHTLATAEQDAEGALEALADALDAPATAAREPRAVPRAPSGPLTPTSIHTSLAALLPEHAIVSDEAILGGFGMLPLTRGAAPHDWLSLMGGAIGQGLPLATGAALACPDRKVVCLEGDGSAMYTLQALWTQAREGLDVTNVIFANRSYGILALELERVGAEPGPRALAACELSRPDLDFVGLARGMGVPAARVSSAEAFHERFAVAMAEPGPCLIEARV